MELLLLTSPATSSGVRHQDKMDRTIQEGGLLVFAIRTRWTGQYRKAVFWCSPSGQVEQNKNGKAVFRSYPCLWSYLQGIICSKAARTRDELWRLIQAAAKRHITGTVQGVGDPRRHATESCMATNGQHFQ